MKRFWITYTATTLVGVASVMAANPFSDVTPDACAYQAVGQLAQEGILNGYPDGTFKGEENLTRYELAQAVSKALAHQDKANAEQQAVINRLAHEFTSELTNLGVRVANLEDRVGHVKVTGDARVRFTGGQEGSPGIRTTNRPYPAYGKHSKFDFRGRLQFKAQVNEKTKAFLQFTTGDTEFGNANGGTATIDNVYVQHALNKNTTLTAGRYVQLFGKGYSYLDTFDGVQVKTGNDKVRLEAAYGKMSAGVAAQNGVDHAGSADNNPEVFYLGASGRLGQGLEVGGFWTHLNAGNIQIAQWDASDNKAKVKSLRLDESQDIYGLNASLKRNRWWLGGEWFKTASLDDSTAWNAGLGYGNFDVKKAGTWNLRTQYFRQEANAPVFNNLSNVQPFDLRNTTRGYQGWLTTLEYAPAKNVGIIAKDGFNAKEVTDSNRKLGNFYRAEVDFWF